MSTTLYLQTNKSVEVNRGRVRMHEIAYVVCENKKIECQCKDLCVIDLSGKKPGAYVITALQLVKAIQTELENVEVTHIGEPGIVLNYEPKPSTPGIWDYIKTAFICLIVFFGSAFSIMTFNTDVNTRELFSNLYQEITGMTSSGFTEMELLYSIGIGIGSLFFFNHFSFKKDKKDPSAMEVKMCLYENDVETTLLNQEAKGNSKS